MKLRNQNLEIKLRLRGPTGGWLHVTAVTIQEAPARAFAIFLAIAGPTLNSFVFVAAVLRRCCCRCRGCRVAVAVQTAFHHTVLFWLLPLPLSFLWLLFLSWILSIYNSDLAVLCSSHSRCCVILFRLPVANVAYGWGQRLRTGREPL